MPKLLEPTRIVVVEGTVFHVRWMGGDIVFMKRLVGLERDFALKRIDDCHFEIEAHLDGHQPP